MFQIFKMKIESHIIDNNKRYISPAVALKKSSMGRSDVKKSRLKLNNV